MRLQRFLTTLIKGGLYKYLFLNFALFVDGRADCTHGPELLDHSMNLMK